MCRHVSTDSLESSEIIDIIDIINQKPHRKERDPHKTKADKPFRLLTLVALWPLLFEPVSYSMGTPYCRILSAIIPRDFVNTP